MCGCSLCHRYGCSLPHVRLQPASPTVAACLTYGCSLPHLRLQPAARTVAGRVFAVEHETRVAAKAREAIAAAGLSDVIEVIEGMSTSIDLPEKVQTMGCGPWGAGRWVQTVGCRLWGADYGVQTVEDWSRLPEPRQEPHLWR